MLVLIDPRCTAQFHLICTYDMPISKSGPNMTEHALLAGVLTQAEGIPLVLSCGFQNARIAY
jgi:hypothetical protein